MTYDAARLGAANIDAQSFRHEYSESEDRFDALVYPLFEDMSGGELEQIREYLEECADNDTTPAKLKQYGNPLDEHRFSEWRRDVLEVAYEYWQGGEGIEDILPVSSWFWPLDTRRDAAELQGRLIAAHLPACIVYHDCGGGVDLALALTGGGVNLTWEIVEAYMLAGQLPPVALAGRLPHMAGRGESASDRAIIAACYESLRIAAMRAEYDRMEICTSYGMTPAELAAFGLETGAA